MKRNMGIGTSAKLVIAPKPLFTICWMPGPPPMKSTAAITLVMKKPTATGMPSIISPSAEPNRISATQYQDMLGLGVRELAEWREEVLAPPEEARELDRHHQERERNPADEQPARRVERAHVTLRLPKVRERDLQPVPRDYEAHCDAREPDRRHQPAARPRREVHKQDLDVDMALLAHEPRCAEARHDEQRVFGEAEEMRRALVAEVAHHHVERDHHHHRRDQQPGEPRHAVQHGVVTARNQGQTTFLIDRH